MRKARQTDFAFGLADLLRGNSWSYMVQRAVLKDFEGIHGPI